MIVLFWEVAWLKLDALIEAILICSSEPVPVSKQSQALEITPEPVEEALSNLDKLYADRVSSFRGLQEGSGLPPGLSTAR